MMQSQDKETAQAQTQTVPKNSTSHSTRFGDVLNTALEDLVDHVLCQSWQILYDDEAMTRDEAEAVAASLIQGRCYYFGEVTTAAAILAAWKEVRNG